MLLVIEHFDEIEQLHLRLAMAVEVPSSLLTVEKKLSMTALS
jgi:hypothetical protein